MMFLS